MIGLVPAESKKRASLVLCAACIAAAGLVSRRPGWPPFVLLYVGDVLWGSLFYVLVACVAPRARVWVLWAAATTLVELIEVSQLYRAPSVERVRATALGGLLLGHGFLWSDVLCVALGTSLAALLAACVFRSTARSRSGSAGQAAPNARCAVRRAKTTRGPADDGATRRAAPRHVRLPNPISIAPDIGCGG